MTQKITRRLLLATTPILLASVAGAAVFLRPLPTDLDLSLSKPTAKAVYSATVAPLAEPVKVGPMHSWVLTLKTADGKPVPEAQIAVAGGMPQHGHGLPTAPAATRSFGDGRFLIEGVRFNMRGWWQLQFAIDGPAGADHVTFNIVL